LLVLVLLTDLLCLAVLKVSRHGRDGDGNANKGDDSSGDFVVGFHGVSPFGMIIVWHALDPKSKGSGQFANWHKALGTGTGVPVKDLKSQKHWR